MEAKKTNEKEGSLLLGLPKYVEIGNGRLRCTETGHELPAKEVEGYSRSKACRLALIDAAVAKKKPPLNTFTQHPLFKHLLQEMQDKLLKVIFVGDAELDDRSRRFLSIRARQFQHIDGDAELGDRSRRFLSIRAWQFQHIQCVSIHNSNNKILRAVF